MAEAAIGFAASAAGLAAFGVQIVTVLNTFATSFARAEQHLTDISANVAITSSILESIGKTIREYEDQFKLTVDNFTTTRDSCERNFQALWVALRRMRRDDLGTDSEEKGKMRAEGGVIRKYEKLNIRSKMIYAMGGADAWKDLSLSIETTKTNLQLLLSSLNDLMLKNLGQSNLLTEEQSEDFRLFMRHLPGLVVGLRQAGLMRIEARNGTQEEKQIRLSIDVATDDVDTQNVTRNLPGPTSNAPPVSQQVSDHSTDVKQREDAAGYLPAKNVIESRDLQRASHDQPNSKAVNQKAYIANQIIEVVPEHGDAMQVQPRKSPVIVDEALIRQAVVERQDRGLGLPWTNKASTKAGYLKKAHQKSKNKPLSHFVE